MANAKKKTTTARKTKAKKEPKLKVVKTKVAKVDETRNYIDEPNFSTDSRDGEKSGAFIKRMLETNALTTAEIVEATQSNFKDSKVAPADVAFHRLALKKQGVELDLVRVDKDGKRYTRNAD
jgi:hypothetical protein